MSIASIVTNQNIYAPKASAYTASGNTAKADPSSIYAPTAAGASHKNSEKPSQLSEGGFLYNELRNRAAASEEELAEQKILFADMYMISAAHKYFYDNQSKAASSSGLLGLRVENARTAHREECMLVPIEAGELPQLMNMIQNSLKNGMSLENILKQKYNDHIAKYGEEGHTNSFADWFAINTSTGEVMSADPISRTYHGNSLCEETADVEAVMDLADDLATFLRYAVFTRETDDPEKIKELFSFIKNKQAYANYDRFTANGDDEAASDTILERLTAAGVLKGDDQEDQEKKEAVDGLMEAIRIHQKELRENKINMKENERVITEIQEIIYDNVK